MYPFLRLAYQVLRAWRMPPLNPTETHVSHHLCWPWDIDLWMELNNGRTLTLFDMGRIPMGQRAGLLALLRKKSWGLTIAGSVVRYRRRVRMFNRIEMRTRTIGWDNRFVYIEQIMMVRGTVTSQAVFRSAVTDRDGIVAPERLLAELAPDHPPVPLPVWVERWITAEAERPWPPELGA
ncbi:MAG: thioesterase family protein [Pseudomonadota bacterium]